MKRSILLFLLLSSYQLHTAQETQTDIQNNTIEDKDHDEPNFETMLQTFLQARKTTDAFDHIASYFIDDINENDIIKQSAKSFNKINNLKKNQTSLKITEICNKSSYTIALFDKYGRITIILPPRQTTSLEHVIRMIQTKASREDIFRGVCDQLNIRTFIIDKNYFIVPESLLDYSFELIMNLESIDLDNPNIEELYLNVLTTHHNGASYFTSSTIKNSKQPEQYTVIIQNNNCSTFGNCYYVTCKPTSMA